MFIRRFDRSILHIPHLPGTFWVRARDSEGRTVTVASGHSVNVWWSLMAADRRTWFLPDVGNYWVEVLLDRDIAVSA